MIVYHPLNMHMHTALAAASAVMQLMTHDYDTL